MRTAATPFGLAGRPWGDRVGLSPLRCEPFIPARRVARRD